MEFGANNEKRLRRYVSSVDIRNSISLRDEPGLTKPTPPAQRLRALLTFRRGIYSREQMRRYFCVMDGLIASNGIRC